MSVCITQFVCYLLIEKKFSGLPLFQALVVLKSREGSVMCFNLTHWGWHKIATIFTVSQTTFLHAFSWMKIYEFQLTFQWSLFLMVKLTIFCLIWQVFGPWASPYGANGQITMTVYNYRSRHETLNGVNPSNGFRDMHSAKSGPNLCQIW